MEIQGLLVHGYLFSSGLYKLIYDGVEVEHIVVLVVEASLFPFFYFYDFILYIISIQRCAFTGFKRITRLEGSLIFKYKHYKKIHTSFYSHPLYDCNQSILYRPHKDLDIKWLVIKDVRPFSLLYLHTLIRFG